MRAWRNGRRTRLKILRPQQGVRVRVPQLAPYNALISLAFSGFHSQGPGFATQSATHIATQTHRQGVPWVLIHRQSGYYFRCRVPARLKEIIGKREIWHPLQTSLQSVAKDRASAVYSVTRKLFSDIESVMNETHNTYSKALSDAIADKGIPDYSIPSQIDPDAIHDIRDGIDSDIRKREFDELIRLYDATIEYIATQYKYSHNRHVYAHVHAVKDQGKLLDHLNDKTVPLINDMQQAIDVLLKKAQVGGNQEIINQINALKDMLGAEFQSVKDVVAISSPAQLQQPASPLFSDAVKRFMAIPKIASKEDDARQRENTYRFFIEVCGDRPVREYTNKDAAKFKDMLARLPANYGKRKKRSGPPVSIIDLVKQADKERYPDRVTGQTLKNHFTRMSTLWTWLIQREDADKPIFTGWDHHENAPKSRGSGYISWPESDLRKLIENPWKSSTIPQSTYGMIVGIAAYTGMRLEEICRLRSQDIEQIDGIPCIRVQEHKARQGYPKAEAWDAKTEAGERLIPIHDELINAGLLTLAENRDYYLFDFKFSARGKRSATFQADFSDFKNKLEIPKKTVVFHSFRHNVSTMLRQRPDGGDDGLREIWIDAFLGHEASHKSSGTKSYLDGIDVRNMKKVADSVQYPAFWNIKRLMGRS